MIVTVTDIVSWDRKLNLNSKEALQQHLETLTDDEFVTVTFKQVVPNNDVETESMTVFTNRLRGHKNIGERKETETLVCFLNYTKQGIEKFDVFVGQEYRNVSLYKEYIPINKLNTDFGLDKNGNVTNIPNMSVAKNELMLYSIPIKNREGEIVGTELLPVFKKITMIDGSFVPCNFLCSKRRVGSLPYFEGTQKTPSGRKTTNYQLWLNNLYEHFVEDAIPAKLTENIKDTTPLVFETAE